MSTRRSTRRFTRNKREYIWCSSILSAVLVTEATTSVPLVEAAEWERGSLGSFQKGVRLEAIRGWLSLQASDGSTTGNGAVYASIVNLDFDEAASNPSAIAEYQEEDILWCGGVGICLGLAGTSPSLYGNFRHYDLDVKSKRKLDSSRVIQLQLATNVATVDARVSGLVRALVSIS